MAEAYQLICTRKKVTQHGCSLLHLYAIRIGVLSFSVHEFNPANSWVFSVAEEDFLRDLLLLYYLTSLSGQTAG
jgi:hypothetical protein